MNRNTIVAACATGLIALGAGMLAGGTGGYAIGQDAGYDSGVTDGHRTGYRAGLAVTPQACLDALDDAEQIISLTSDALTISADAVVYASEWDYVSLGDATEDIEGINAELERVDYAGPAADCRAGAR